MITCTTYLRLIFVFDLKFAMACFQMVVVFIHNMRTPVRFVNQLKSKGLRRSHPVHVATAAGSSHPPAKEKEKVKEKGKRDSSGDQARFKWLVERFYLCNRRVNVDVSPCRGSCLCRLRPCRSSGSPWQRTRQRIARVWRCRRR